MYMYVYIGVDVYVGVASPWLLIAPSCSYRYRVHPVGIRIPEVGRISSDVL